MRTTDKIVSTHTDSVADSTAKHVYTWGSPNRPKQMLIQSPFGACMRLHFNWPHWPSNAVHFHNFISPLFDVFVYPNGRWEKLWCEDVSETASCTSETAYDEQHRKHRVIMQCKRISSGVLTYNSHIIILVNCHLTSDRQPFSIDERDVRSAITNLSFIN